MLYDRKTGVVKLIDFGLAKNVNSTEMNGGWCGTPGYMKCNTEGRPIPITPKSCDEIESYALAITLLRMKTGYDGYHKVAKEIRGQLPMERNSKSLFSYWNSIEFGVRIHLAFDQLVRIQTRVFEHSFWGIYF